MSGQKGQNGLLRSQCKKQRDDHGNACRGSLCYEEGEMLMLRRQKIGYPDRKAETTCPGRMLEDASGKMPRIPVMRASPRRAAALRARRLTMLGPQP